MATNNVAEYKALITGLKFALKKGFTEMLGDSKLVCMQKYNAKADAQANAAIHVGGGERKEDCVYDNRN